MTVNVVNVNVVLPVNVVLKHVIKVMLSGKNNEKKGRNHILEHAIGILDNLLPVIC